jgi:dienelactone hydrolase
MVPNWMGVTDDAVERAKEIAGTDFVVLVADVYGKDVRPADAKAASEQTRKMYADRHTLRARALKALDVLRENAAKAPLDAGKLGAVGFCFGGATVLEMARAGADLAGVVSLHGGLSTDLPATATPKASILVLNGAADSYVPAEEIAAFQAEMTKVDADWQFVNYAGAVHCFAEASAASPPGCVYHPVAAKRAFAALRGFFGERFTTP